MLNLQATFGQIDIYLFDQLLRGRITPGMRVLDAGSGPGRNLLYLLGAGFEVFAADQDAAAIETIRQLAAKVAPNLPGDNFRTEAVEAMSFAAESMDVVLSNAVLHFAADDRQFDAMLRGSWRVLRRGGILFCRLASSIGLESRLHPLGGRRYALPDGSERYLVDEAFLLDLTKTLGGELIDPLKTTIVQNQRCMTTWVMRRVG